ncbi:MAG: hypothetical protein R3C26_03175 [Calditrichia bacterium]
MEESRFPAELTSIFKNLENSGNPWGMAPDDREEWAEGLNVPTMRDAEGDVKSPRFMGCAGTLSVKSAKNAAIDSQRYLTLQASITRF